MSNLCATVCAASRAEEGGACLAFNGLRGLSPVRAKAVIGWEAFSGGVGLSPVSVSSIAEADLSLSAFQTVLVAGKEKAY